MNELQNMIRNPQQRDLEKEYAVKNGSNLEQWLIDCWGYKDGKVGNLILTNFVKLAKQYTYEELFECIKFAGEMNKKNYRYVEVSLEKRKEKKSQAAKPVVKQVWCNICEATYWSHQPHRCVPAWVKAPCGKEVHKEDYGEHIDLCQVCESEEKKQIQRTRAQLQREFPREK